VQSRVSAHIIDGRVPNAVLLEIFGGVGRKIIIWINLGSGLRLNAKKNSNCVVCAQSDAPRTTSYAAQTS
jgi:hypothetical protein